MEARGKGGRISGSLMAYDGKERQKGTEEEAGGNRNTS